jgi:hypothetical protein
MALDDRVSPAHVFSERSCGSSCASGFEGVRSFQVGWSAVYGTADLAGREPARGLVGAHCCVQQWAWMPETSRSVVGTDCPDRDIEAASVIEVSTDGGREDLGDIS